MKPPRSKTTFLIPAMRARWASRVPTFLAFSVLAPPPPQPLFQAGGGDQGPAGLVVNHLGIDMAEAAEDGQAGALGGALHLLPHPQVTADPCLAGGYPGHYFSLAAFPALP